jgi:glucose-1-phosphate adenylyltransferase
VYDSLISEGCIISGATIINTVISPDVRVHSYATVLDSMILSGVDIGEYCEIKNAIIDKNVKIPRGARIGYDLELDEARGFKIIKSRGIVIVPKDYKFREE